MSLYEEFFDASSKDTKKSNVIQYYDFELFMFDNIYKKQKDTQKLIEKGNRKLKTYFDLSKDLFFSLYKHYPLFNSKHELKHTHVLNYDIISFLFDNDKFKKIRNETRLNPVATMYAYNQMQNILYSIVKNLLKDEKAKDIIQSIQNNGEGNQSQPNNNQDNQSQQINQDDLEYLNQLLNNVLKKEKHFIEYDLWNIEKETTDLNQFISSWGINQSDNTRSSPDEVLEMYQKILNNSTVMKITNMLGKFKEFVHALSIENKDIFLKNTDDVVIGANLENILPSERAMLALKKPMKYMFYNKFVNKQLMQYSETSKVPVGKGPIVICLDKSGSMSGEREVWAKALTLAVSQIANKQKRAMAIIPFDLETHPLFHFEKGNMTTKDIYNIATISSSGGTNFTDPLTKAFEVIKKESGFEKADILFITDDDCKIDKPRIKDFIKTKEETKTKLTAVFIGIEKKKWKSGLEKIADYTTHIKDIVNEGDAVAKDIFKQF